MSDTITLIQRSQQGDRDASERLVTENTGLIWSIARRYFGRGVEPDDLFQLGCVGFLKAVEGFDTAYGTQFSTYAVPKIAGEIRRFLRDDGAVKVSRSVKERAAAIKKVRERLTGDFAATRRSPSCPRRWAFRRRRSRLPKPPPARPSPSSARPARRASPSRMSCVQTAWRKSCSNAWPCRRRLPA